MRGPLLFAIDIDGTLLNSEYRVDGLTQFAIHKAMRRGHFVSLATGRMPALTLVWSRYLRLNAPAITLNGANIIDPTTGEQFHFTRIDDEPLQRLVNWAQQEGLHCRLIGHRYIVCRKDQSKHLDRVLGIHYRVPSILLPPDLGDYLNKPVEPVLKVAVGCRDKEHMAEVFAELQSWNAFELSRTEGNEIEITAGNTTKLAGIHHVIQRLNIPLSNVVAFGNAENDLEMLRNAGRGYAVANAEPIVLEQIPLKTASNDDSGVGKAIENLLAEMELRVV
jgi:5-amino-6-(5-phospho-D-ribitylamino)uracil phosphatase